MLDVNEKEEGVVAFKNLPYFDANPVSTSPLADDIATARSGLVSQEFTCISYVRKEMFYLMTHSTHFTYGYMASDIW